MNKSEDISELAKALSKAQGEMGGADKGANNPFFKSKYADLGSVVRAIKEPFSSNGLSYSQTAISQDGMYGVTTILMHESGQYISSDLLLPLGGKGDAQAVGSVITYARRYALQSMAGIPAEDDDGNSGSGFSFDDTAKGWVEAIKSGSTTLDSIHDADYRLFIKGKLK